MVNCGKPSSTRVSLLLVITSLNLHNWTTEHLASHLYIAVKLHLLYIGISMSWGFIFLLLPVFIYWQNIIYLWDITIKKNTFSWLNETDFKIKDWIQFQWTIKDLHSGAVMLSTGDVWILYREHKDRGHRIWMDTQDCILSHGDLAPISWSSLS